ncbi:hypothetical protein THAOC_30572, partial [Thalassiosira oceanica]
HEHAAAVIGTGRKVILRPIWISELEGGISRELEGGYLAVEARTISTAGKSDVKLKSSAELETLFEHQEIVRDGEQESSVELETLFEHGVRKNDTLTINDRAQRIDHEAIDSVMPSQPRFALWDSNDGDSSVCSISESEGEYGDESIGNRSGWRSDGSSELFAID